MPDFHIKMNKTGTLIFAKRIGTTKNYPSPYNNPCFKNNMIIEHPLQPNATIRGIIQHKDMCSAITKMNEWRIKAMIGELM